MIFSHTGEQSHTHVREHTHAHTHLHMQAYSETLYCCSFYTADKDALPKKGAAIMSCRGSRGHLFVYTVFHKQYVVNHLRWLISTSQWRLHLALNTVDSCSSILLWLFTLMPPLLRCRCRCSILGCTCTCGSSPVPACQPCRNPAENTEIFWAMDRFSFKCMKHYSDKIVKTFQKWLCVFPFKVKWSWLW